ncbi:hypothetical protein AB0H92_08180 [Streptomyces phaeochromogenes]|uniref:hypothetical protein n=1 Tax=Streptomyces phaeochromogenes TaxID=1923 RepID=UPI0033E61FD8
MRRIDWGQLSTAAGVFLGAAGLALTGVATYYGARVSDDQLEQSREDAAREEQAQARQISSWVTRQDGSEQIHVLNRSLDAVNWPQLAFVVTRSITPDSNELKSSSVLYVSAQVGTLSPCTELIISRSSVKLLKRGRLGLDSGEAKQVNRLIQVRAIMFMDNAGRYWVRNYRMLISVKPEIASRALGEFDDEVEVVIDSRQVDTKPVQNCGAAS